MPLPTHRVEIVKSFNNEQWANDYLINAADMASAEAAALALSQFERAIHFDFVLFEYARVSTFQVADRIFDHLVINAYGSIARTSVTALPLFVCMRLDLRTNDSDPGRKYYRGCLLSNEIVNVMDYSPTTRASRQAIVDGHAGRPSLQGVVTNKGNAVTNQVIYPRFQERQLKRRNKKKVETP